jgi:hypothetical protein
MKRWREPIMNGPSSWLVETELGCACSLMKSQGMVGRKQFCPFFGGKSLLAHTRDRLKPLFLEDNTFFVLNRAHRTHYRTDLSSVRSRRKLVQPSNRGTAPAGRPWTERYG